MISSASSEAPLIVWLLKLPSTTTWKDLKDCSRPFMIEQPGEAWVFTDDKGLRWGTVTCRCVADAHSLIEKLPQTWKATLTPSPRSRVQTKFPLSNPLHPPLFSRPSSLTELQPTTCVDQYKPAEILVDQYTETEDRMIVTGTMVEYVALFFGNLRRTLTAAALRDTVEQETPHGFLRLVRPPGKYHAIVTFRTGEMAFQALQFWQKNVNLLPHEHNEATVRLAKDSAPAGTIGVEYPTPLVVTSG